MQAGAENGHQEKGNAISFPSLTPRGMDDSFPSVVLSLGQIQCRSVFGDAKGWGIRCSRLGGIASAFVCWSSYGVFCGKGFCFLPV